MTTIKTITFAVRSTLHGPRGAMKIAHLTYIHEMSNDFDSMRCAFSCMLSMLAVTCLARVDLSFKTVQSWPTMVTALY